MKNLVDIIAKLSQKLGQTEEAAKEQFKFNELTLTQMYYLETISNLKNPNVTELAKAMGLTKPTVTVAVDKLTDKDFIYKVQSDEDRRSSHLHLTEKGKLINEMHDYAHRRFAESMRKSLTESELNELTVLLNKLLAKI
jgi:DNA-binding MarR family transcriptional regulator